MNTLLKRSLALLIAFSGFVLPGFAETPAVQGKAPDFTLSTPEGQPVRLSNLLKQGDVALVFLRGFPGYQCPICQRQVHDLELDSAKFAASGIQLLLVYPGQAAQLDQRAKEFMTKEDALPANFHLVIDPDFTVTNLYGLRWNADRETAYPSTFLLDKTGKVMWLKISHTHGDRATTGDILGALGTPGAKQ
jgi:peroxiredoxin